MNSIELIKKLSNANGVSGFEDEVTELAKEIIGKDYPVYEDKIRNLYINNIEKNERTKPVVMLDAHSDEVGFMVQSIEPNGLLKFISLGGWSNQQIPAHKVRILNKEGNYVEGIISSIPPHFTSKADAGKVTDMKDMFIDVGTTSYDETVNNFKIGVGAPVIPDVECTYNENSRMFLGKAFDDRVGCAVILDVMKELKGKELSVSLTGVLSSQEEEGCRGALVAAQKVMPDLAIVLEGPPADDNFRNEYRSQGALRKGAQVRHIDPTMIANPRLIRFIQKIAEENNIKIQETVRESGGTNASKIHLENGGIPTVVIGIPVRYTHSHYGFISYDDYIETVKLVKAIAENITKDIIESL
ncbi:M20/M25/M40 family metallo-hydrolase [Fusobacterium perfoetens]|uniref:M42 family metallopeptidase n=1 Tax=Fusobacterium perfoetens TaxID=852 RepID=UPI001F1B3F70|nr:M20/M25/M40 family metallo-hydrolase [Fusobacterium perfoetens]MCF2625213.1 M20/M25/M40 family metallo-hydrolase [Fusobacterium perfoetens]